MYHLKALIAAHRAKLFVAVLGYLLYQAIDPSGSAYPGFAAAAVILMALLVFVPAMLVAAHVDHIKPGTVKRPYQPSRITRQRTPAGAVARSRMGRSTRTVPAQARNRVGVSGVPRRQSALAGSVLPMAGIFSWLHERDDMLPSSDDMVMPGFDGYSNSDTGASVFGDDSVMTHATAGLLEDHGVNPASGLPMLDSVIDVAGNVFGSDSTHSLFEHDVAMMHVDTIMHDDSFGHHNHFHHDSLSDSFSNDSWSSSFSDDSWS